MIFVELNRKDELRRKKIYSKKHQQKQQDRCLKTSQEPQSFPQPD